MKNIFKYLMTVIIVYTVLIALIVDKNISFIVSFVNMFYLVIPAFAIKVGISKKTSFFMNNSLFKNKVKKEKLNILNVITRVFILLIGIVCLWFFTRPIIHDTLNVIFYKEIANASYTVSRRDSGIKYYGLINEYIYFKEKGNESYSYYFPLRKKLILQKRYKFRILPHSKIILIAETLEK